jgi:uncharacterized damage-inducible protein DinB
MKNYFRQLAKYNQWANDRLYAAVFELPKEMYRKPTGVFSPHFAEMAGC